MVSVPPGDRSMVPLRADPDCVHDRVKLPVKAPL
jgi:hypothetical protein